MEIGWLCTHPFFFSFSFFYVKSTFLWHTKSRRRFKMDEKNVIDDDDDDTTRYSGAAR